MNKPIGIMDILLQIEGDVRESDIKRIRDEADYLLSSMGKSGRFEFLEGMNGVLNIIKNTDSEMAI